MANMDTDLQKRTSASAAPRPLLPSASAATQPPLPPASAAPLPLLPPASAAPQRLLPPAPAAPQPLHPPASATPQATLRRVGELPAAPTPRILILSSEQKKLSSLSPFQRREGCDRLGKALRCDKLRDGGIEVEFESECDARRALTATEFTFSIRDDQGKRLTSVPISVSAHRTKNYSRGIVYCVDLEDVSDDDIAEGLSEYGVVSARRIKSRNKRTGVLEPTHNIILTFNQIDMPREVTVGYVKVKVRTYFPSPMRCFRCLRFGHTRDHCRNRPTCSKCAATDHTGEACTEATRKCVNCDAPHSAFDPSCPALLREKEIVAIKITERLSFREAREKYNSSHPKRSYATVTRETRPGPTGNNQQNINQQSMNQLISLLQSFGLRLVTGPGVSSGQAAPVPPPVTAPLATAATQTSPTSREGPSEDGWTKVGGRRGPAPRTSAASRAGSETSPPPSPPTPSRPPGSTVMEALRRGEEERRAREARRARMAEKAREPRRSPVADVPSVPQGSQPPLTPPTGRSPPMGPPPPPPPIRRPPPLPPGAASEAQPPSMPAPGAPKQPAPSVAKERPAKRILPQEGSPTEGGSPRARQRFQPGSTGGRSLSADGRQRRDHPRIQYGGNPRSGASEYF